MTASTWNAIRALAILVAVLALALAVHYYVRLHLMTHSAVIIEPGKWVWAACETHRFSATIENVTLSGLVLRTETGQPHGLPCEVVGVTVTGDHRYFMPFRTVLGISVSERRIWSNPFSM